MVLAKFRRLYLSRESGKTAFSPVLTFCGGASIFWERMKKLDLDGIITDYPDRALKIFRKLIGTREARTPTLLKSYVVNSGLLLGGFAPRQLQLSAANDFLRLVKTKKP